MKRALLLASLLTAAAPVAAVAQFITAITPNSGPVAGGTKVTIIGGGFESHNCVRNPGSCFTDIFFGAEQATNFQIVDDSHIVVTIPAHLPSTTAVSVEIFGSVAPQRLAFTYTGDPATNFARMLIPILVPPIPGQFGSEFVTEFRALWINPNPDINPSFVRLFGIPACLCPQLLDQVDDAMAVASDPGPIASTQLKGSPGRIVFIHSEFAGHMSMNLRVHDTSRVAATIGAEVPIVPDSAFRSTPFVLLGVPADVRYRNTLRIYSAEPGIATSVRVTIDHSFQTVTLRPGRDLFDPGYFEMTLPPRFESGSTINTIPVTIEPLTPGARVWAFVSATNNDTQQITVIAPHP